MENADRLRELVGQNEWLMRVLRAVRAVELPDWIVGSGAIRNLVWDELHGFTTPTPLNDVDVAFFDPSDVSRERDAAIESRLSELLPGVPWEVTNQAGVHLWYEAKFGIPIPAVTSTRDALGLWPETATAVGVRLERDDALTVVAPLGLDDLFGLVFRRNPAQMTRAIFLERLTGKKIRERWPKVTVVDD